MKMMSNIEYRENRAKFPLDELRKHEGQWVAFSTDGLRIIASGASIADVDNALRAANEDLQDNVLERIVFDYDESFLGGAEIEFFFDPSLAGAASIADSSLSAQIGSKN